MLKIIAMLAMLFMASCAGTSATEIPAGPTNATAWCGQFDFTGTLTKTETSGSALGVSDAAIIEGATIEQIIELAEAMGCNG